MNGFFLPISAHGGCAAAPIVLGAAAALLWQLVRAQLSRC
jgi:hypothetical protein